MLNKKHSWVLGRTVDGPIDSQREWIKKHFYDVPQIIMEKLALFGIDLKNKVVLDFGCGDSIIDFGFIEIANPKKLIATDIESDSLNESRRRISHMLGNVLNSSDKMLRVQNTNFHIPIESSSVDVAFSWSTFEHVRYPLEGLQELRRVIRQNGILFIQIFPMYYSSYGHHMWWDTNFPRFFHLKHPWLFKYRLKRFYNSDEYTETFKQVIKEEVESLNKIRAREIKQILIELDFNILYENFRPDVYPNKSHFSWRSTKEFDCDELYIICQKVG
jgi:ubiquinone/menaquinone biosynthesis C-methylase UbiE